MPPHECHPFRRRGDMIVTPATLFSQRAEPSPLWLRTICQRPIGHGTTRISRVRCEKAKRVFASRVPGGKAIERPFALIVDECVSM